MNVSDLLDPEKMKEIDSHFDHLKQQKNLSKALHREYQQKFIDNNLALNDLEETREKKGMELMQNEDDHA